MKLTELTGKNALLEIERQLDAMRLRIHALEQKQNKPAVVKSYLQGFEEFWQAYPKKRGKGYAERVWSKLRPDRELLDKILDSIKAARRSEEWQKDCGQFIPHPSSWLNAKGWENEYKSFTPSPKPVVVAERKIVREVDTEHEKKVALWKSLPEEEQKRRMGIAKDHYKNNQFFQMSSDDVKRKLLTGKVLETL